MDSEIRKDLFDKMFCSSIDRRTRQQYITRFEKFKQYRGDRRHPAAKYRTLLGFIPQTQPLFKDFKIRIVDAAVDQARLFPLRLFTQTVSQLKEGFSFFRIFENKGRGLEDRTFKRAFREFGPVAIRHHLTFGAPFDLISHSTYVFR